MRRPIHLRKRGHPCWPTLTADELRTAVDDLVRRGVIERVIDREGVARLCLRGSRDKKALAVEKPPS